MQSRRRGLLLPLQLLSSILLVSSMSATHRAGNGETTGISVGILTQGAFWKGLFRDAEIVAWGLSANRGKDSSISTSIFYTRWFKDAEAGVRDEGTYKADALDEGARGTLLFDLAVPEGTDMKGWLGSLDVFISFESPLLAIFQLAERLRVRRSILVLNIDWSCAKEIRRISEVPNLQFWVKGPGSERAIREVLGGGDVKEEREREQEREREREREEGARCRTIEREKVFRVPWTIPDPIVQVREPNAAGGGGGGSPVTFLMIVGMGGVQSRRGVDVALRAFHRAMELAGDKLNAHFLLSSTLFPFPVEEQLLEHTNVSVVYQVHAREELSELLAEADAVLYPSRWEGFGLSMMEALHAGVPVLATDGWPMNEVVTDNVNGLLLKAAYMGNFFADDHKCTIQEFAEDSCKEMMGPHWEVDVEDMARAIVRFSTDEELRRRLSAPHPHVLLSRQFAFMNTIQSLVREDRRPRSIVLHLHTEAKSNTVEAETKLVDRLHEGLQAFGFATRRRSEVGEEDGACSDLLLIVAAPPSNKEDCGALLRSLTTWTRRAEEQQRGRRGPVIMVQSGGGEREGSWADCGGLHNHLDALFVEEKARAQDVCSFSLPNVSAPPSHQVAELLALSSLQVSACAGAGRSGQKHDSSEMEDEDEDDEQEQEQEQERVSRLLRGVDGRERRVQKAAILKLLSWRLFDQVVGKLDEFFLKEVGNGTSWHVSRRELKMLRATTSSLLRSCKMEEASRLEALTSRIVPRQLSPCALSLLQDHAMVQTFFFRLQRTLGPTCIRRLQQVWSRKRLSRPSIAEILCREYTE
uniref:Glycosyl transferase family 1 domain-containing protein n=1 Tax=Guillardia theta TaxID=55529 RepID=A0A7S4NGV0_GUITH|mmetsp:Transcript_21854/g.72231  ORF Transcript_21854/g.72231 Transcript_21854/m.72231 type:complete len:810 (+) Transcript_21854:118-2547(+)